MADKVLFVDDEAAVLDGFKRILYRDFDVDTAVGAEQGLGAIRERGPYAVVVSDMRMPGMNGAQFLAEVRQQAPDTVRMLLTGFTDLNAAMDAVNQGNIFRFLTKPCEKEVLGKALADGLVQYRLVTAEKELLEKTLMGSIQVLTEVLGAASPEAFGRSMRIAGYVRQFVQRFQLTSAWRFEAAAMLSQLGCVTLDPHLIKAAYSGEPLPAEDHARFAAHPQIARDLLSHIPRLEPVAWMIGQQFTSEDMLPSTPRTSQFDDDVVFGAKLLRLAIQLDNLKLHGNTDEQAVAELTEHHSEFGAELIQALTNIKPESADKELRRVPVSKLVAGMILEQEIRTQTGILVVPKGQAVTPALVIKLNNYAQAETIAKELMVLTPMAS